MKVKNNELVEKAQNLSYYAIKSEKVEVKEDEKAIIHYISTPDKDRGGDVVNPKGMDDEDFAKSPAIWYNHEYSWNPHALPIGKSLWRKKEDEGVLVKSQFNDLEFSQDVYYLHKIGDMATWSIGWSIDRSKKNAVKYVPEEDTLYINNWLLFEYSSAPIAMNPNAVDRIKSLQEVKFKSATMQNLVNNLEVEMNVEEQVKSLETEIKTLQDAYKRLEELIANKDNEDIKKLSEEILFIKKLIEQKEEKIETEIKINIEEPKKVENLGMTDEQLKKLVSDKIAGEFSRIRGLE